MKARLIDQSSLKDSGIKWALKISSQYSVEPLFTVLNENNIKNDLTTDYNVLSLSYGKLVVKDKESNKGLLSANNDSYQIIRPGNIILRLTDLQNDKRSLRVGYANDLGIITSAYVGLTPKNNTVNTKFFYYLLHSYDLLKVFYGYGGGIRQGMTYKDLKKLPLILPSDNIQKKIVSYLDSKLAIVDKFVSNKYECIEKLKQSKQAIINNALTKGLDVDAPTKASCIDWLGDIPNDWVIYPLKRLAKINEFSLGEKTDPDTEIIYVDISGVDSEGCIINKESFNFIDAPSRARRIVRHGDTIISTVRTYLRAIGYISEPESNLIVSTGFAVCIPNTKIIDQEFLQYAIRSNYFIENVVASSYGVSYPAITAESLGCHKIAIPKKISEQKAIIAHIKSEFRVIDKAIKKAEYQINFIKEYRSSLVTHAVTGQLEIKE